MNLSDPEIRQILKGTRTEYTNDIELENNIMKSIDGLKGYDAQLTQIKKRARIGLRSCFVLMTLLIISTVRSLLTMKNQVLSQSEILLPTVVVLIMLIILFSLIQWSKGAKVNISE